jgi:hypothetical protein
MPIRYKKPSFFITGFLIVFMLLAVVWFSYSILSMKPKHGEKFKISAGILTHFAPITLRSTLENFKDSGFMDAVDDLFVVIQKSDRQHLEKEVCESFNVRHIVMPDNGKMASGFKSIYDNAKNDILLFLENDFTIHPSNGIDDFLTNALYFLNERGCDYIRARSRNFPGDPNYAVDWYKESPSTYSEKYSSAISESIFWDTHPEKTYPSKISKIVPIKGDEAWYTSSSKYCNYTNNPFLCKRDFFKKAIYPHLIFGENVEARLVPIWSKQDYTCVFGPGLFSHARIHDGHS